MPSLWSELRSGSVRLLASLAMLAASSGAMACIVEQERAFEDLRTADFVVVARLVAYERAAPGADSPAAGYAVLTLDVQETLSGERRGGVLEVSWANWTFGLPDTLVSGRYLVGVMKPGRGPWPGTSTGYPASWMHALLQPPCTKPFLVPATAELLAEARRLLGTR